MKDKMTEYEVENLKLKLALQCMQRSVFWTSYYRFESRFMIVSYMSFVCCCRKIDDICTLGFVHHDP